MDDCSIFHYFCWWCTCNFITGTFSAYEPAIPLIALNSPTPKVVIRAAIPFMRAYPSAHMHLIHYNCQSTLNFYVLPHHLKRQDYNHQEPQIYVQFLIRVVYPINMYLQYIVFQMNHLLIMQ